MKKTQRRLMKRNITQALSDTKTCIGHSSAQNNYRTTQPTAISTAQQSAVQSEYGDSTTL